MGRMEGVNINLPEEMLSDMWEKFDWDEIEQKLLYWQKELTFAALKKHNREIKKIQNKIVGDIKFKALAVHKVAEGNHSGAGIDGVLWTSNSEKMGGALSLSADEYRAQPLKRIIVQDKNKNKERRIGVPTVRDRAMQVLYAFALTPIAEATAERKSFAFRKGRSALDAHYYVCDALTRENAPEWVFIGDIKSYYESISHKWLLEHIPMNKKVLREFLKAGFAFRGEIFPTDVGISLGANISPVLGNMALDTLQYAIFDNMKNRCEDDFNNGNLIRFADDILVTANSKEDAEEIKDITENFLYERGLKLSEEKSKIVHVSEGFDFLSRHYCKHNGHLSASPSDLAIKAFENNLQEYILNHNARWSQRSLIKGLNAKLQGWAGYHRITEASDAFRHIDSVVSALLLRLLQDIHPQKSKDELIEKYWYKEADGTKVFALPDRNDIRIVHLRDVVLTTHTPLKTKANPYLDSDYFEERLENHEINKVNGKYKAVWERQSGKCYYCGNLIDVNQEKKIIFKTLSGDKSIKNMAYIHALCSEDDAVFCHLDIENPNDLDVFDIVQEVMDIDSTEHRCKNKSKKSLYAPLHDYFQNCKRTQFTLPFSQIEKIIGQKLCDSAYKYTSYWYKLGKTAISNAWSINDYSVSRIDLKNKKVAFKKIHHNYSKLKIPEIFLTNDIPNKAKYELERFFEYIKKKYGL